MSSPNPSAAQTPTAPTQRAQDRWGDLILVLAITILIGLVSQRWTGLDTPDSGFYATLALFGDQITDRAPIDSYYWTRLGYIFPVHVITSLVGPWIGFEIWRFFLILLSVASVHVTLHRFAGRRTSAAFTSLLAMSTVVLSYFGNTYVTGTVLAATFALLACAIVGRSTYSRIASGMLLGWLSMLNPYGAILGGGLWLIIIVSRSGISLRLLRTLAITAASAAVTFALLWIAGRWLFPGLDWWGTYVEWNSNLNYADFASQEKIWLQDISLLVPAMIFIISIARWMLQKFSKDEPTDPRTYAALVSVGTLAISFGFSPYMAGITLEAPIYQAMLWPPALLALGLTLLPEKNHWSLSTTVIFIISGITIVFVAFYPGVISYSWGLTIAVLVVGMVILGSSFAQKRLSSRHLTSVAIVLLAITLVGGTILQNSRRDLGLYYLSPYSWAVADNPVAAKVRVAVNTQEWLLSKTTDQDQLLVWVDGQWVNGDRELYAVAAMQLWGENRLTLEEQLSKTDVERLSSIRPTGIVLYGPSMNRIESMRLSIPQEAGPTGLECYDFAWPSTAIPVGHACLVRLRWATP